uniref:rRNA-processing protein UTP23 homolog n=1 Tax=Amphiprion ocellaris TaxID=80972 RepID=A0AAQ5ZR69_AMPOC
MKIKRQKQAKKSISFYKYNFSFREPFQILLDGTFCQAALKNKIQIKEQLPKYLMGEVQLCTTSCALKELEVLGKQLYGAKIILQRFQVRKCPHVKDPVSASECFLSMLQETNPQHYFIATQFSAPYSSIIGPHSDLRPEEDPRRPAALHRPQHHSPGQSQPRVAATRAGRPAGGAGEREPAAEHQQPEEAAGPRPDGRREKREEEEEETEQPQPSELPEEEEEERRSDGAAEEDRGGREEETQPTQEKKNGGRKQDGRLNVLI